MYKHMFLLDINWIPSLCVVYCMVCGWISHRFTNIILYSCL